MNKVLKGDALTVLKTLPSEFINCTVTSPPYWGLRDYGIEPIIWDGNPNCKHEWIIETKEKITQDFTKLHTWNGDGRNRTSGKKTTILKNKITNGFCSKCGAWKGSLGLEPTFDLYIKHLCDIFDEVKRVLRKDGTLWVNLGDTYNSKISAPNMPKLNKRYDEYYEKTKKFRNEIVRKSGILEKSLCLIPFRFAIEMVNRGWILRNVIIWHKPNCMPSSAKDRFTVDFEYLFFFVKNKKYWFEQQFEPQYWNGQSGKKNCRNNEIGRSDDANKTMNSGGVNEQGRNKRTVWTIPTKPYPEAHFAVYPAELIRTCIKAGCPKEVCKKCGKAREKIYEKGELVPTIEGSYPENQIEQQYGIKKGGTGVGGHSLPKRELKEIGYTDCHCNAGFEGGVVLDPFAGSGTTLEEAIRQGKNYIGIELKDDYIKLIEKRLSKVQVSLI